MSFRYIEREGASELILKFLFWSVASILITRFYLYLSPVKEISFGVWHIAHVLWGGLFMLIGFLLVVGYSGRRILNLVAAFEGVGWGLFVDEIGKYLTKDNDYWFKPAIIFIYVSFIMIFLVYRYLARKQRETVEGKFFGLLEGLEEIMHNDLEKKEKEVLLKRIDYIIKHDKIGEISMAAMSVKQLLKKKRVIEDRSWIGASWIEQIRLLIEKLLKVRYFRVGLWMYTIYWGATKILDTFFIATSPEKSATIQQYFEDYNFAANSDFYMISFKIFFDSVAAVFFVVGAGLFWTKKRKTGLTFYRNGLLISIFLSSIFKFYFEQFSGVFDLSLSALAFYIIGQYTKYNKQTDSLASN